MEKYIEVTGKNQDAAIAAGLAQLGLERDDVSVEILELGKSGFLGIGSTPTRIKMTYQVPDEPEPKPELKKEQKKESTPAEKKSEPVKEAPAEKNVPAKENQASETDSHAKANTAHAETAATSHKSRHRSRSKSSSPSQSSADTEKKHPEQNLEQKIPAAGEKTDRITSFLTGLLKCLDNDAKPVVTRTEDGLYQVELVGSDLGALIGRRGEMLDAIQQLTNYAVNRGSSHRVRIRLDAENYRAKREETLTRLARKTADKALKYHRNMTLEPMNAYERHVIHTALQDYEGVTTYSTGSEPNRRVIVALDRGSRQEQ